MRFWLIAVITLTFTSCAGNPPPTVTPEAQRDYHLTQVIKGLDQARDAVVAAHNTKPPIVDAQTSLKVVTWHQDAIKIVHDAASGWQAALQTTFDGLKKDLSAQQWAIIQPYVELVQALLKEVA